MEMQPPSEADIVAAVRMLETRRVLKLSQLDALQTIHSCLTELSNDNLSDPYCDLIGAVSTYLGYLITEYQLDAEALGNQAKYTQHALDSARSSLVLPRANPRRPIS
jgi:hypothetical protein